MKRLFFLFIFLTVALAACAPAATPAPTVAPTVAPTKPVTTAPAVTTAPTTASNVAPTQPAAASGGKVTFKIVPGQSKVTYEVAETFINQNNRLNVAVGVTSEINGEIFADKANPQQSTLGAFTVDISKFTSDSGQRDNAIRGRWLESSKFPLAKFVPTKIESLPAAYKDGQEYAFKVTGDLTVRQATKPVTFDLTAKLSGDTLTGKASTTLLMSDFGVGPISILGILNTEDKVKLSFEFTAKP